MSWNSTGDRADRIARESNTPTDRLLALLIKEIEGLRQDLADERQAAERRRERDRRR
jgi:hypothetical protein